ncbi:hypothetical protein [Arcticibacterium luteifluviistationis]|uniref:ATP-binding protein n=1 Tax=Arcticibacterium luteifluviistationis TaxID=1784714 RepID=A0A2Z4GCV5_9BACT|nr:hypothetical protein [Arcticibacterium luteifluviistationis]AWV99142.1 hypothetical protein DJ013_13580 [Arcticibacterium luteifluviistationis]
MKSPLLLALLPCALLFSCSSQPEETTEDTAEITSSDVPTLSIAWETDTTLITPESVIYDAANDVYYATCIGVGRKADFDGDGYIAKIGPNGEIIDNHWVKNLDDPKGLALVGSTLYATDLNKLVSVNVNTGETTIEIVEGAQYLNDAASTPDGDILLTDSDLNTVFLISSGVTTIVLADTTIGRLNGIFHEADRNILTGFRSGKLFAQSGSDLKMVADGVKTADGIEAIGDGYFISCWDGLLYYFDKNWNKTLLKDTSAEGIGAADIDYIADKKLLVVPTFFGNKVVAYHVK